MSIIQKHKLVLKQPLNLNTGHPPLIPDISVIQITCDVQGISWIQMVTVYKFTLCPFPRKKCICDMDH